jgi:hypothetical protein
VKKIILASLLVFVLRAPIAAAQSGGAYSLTRSTVDGGGQTFATGGAYQVGGTAGQPDAGPMTGGLYALNGGFWAPATSGPVDAPAADPVPAVFAARLPWPNPFRACTTLAFDLPTARFVQLDIHGLDGRIVRRLAQEGWDAGRHLVIWDGRDDRGRPVASGIYFVRLVAGEFTSTQRVVRLD